MSLPALTEAQRTLLVSSALKGKLELSLSRYSQLTPTTRFVVLSSRWVLLALQQLQGRGGSSGRR